jgi:putative membrane protein
MMSGNDGMWFGGGYMWFFWILVPLVIFWVFKSMSNESSASTSSNDTIESPIDILKKRYANGEIDKEEYNERLSELKNK